MLFNAQSILLEDRQWYYLIHSWDDKEVQAFAEATCPKVNLIARLEFELAYYDSAVQRFNHYTTKTPPRSIVEYPQYPSTEDTVCVLKTSKLDKIFCRNPYTRN